MKHNWIIKKTKTMAKFKLKHSYYAAPTPETMRKIGDVCLIIAACGVPESFTHNKWIGSSMVICGILGKVLTNFFKDETTDKK